MEFDSTYSDNSTNNQTLDKLNPALAELGPAQPQLVLQFFQIPWQILEVLLIWTVLLVVKGVVQ